jgi:cyclopropane fatty-acyl-phospholipid synthase-like methyltransferase
MTVDPREGNARYYDLEDNPLGDVPFYSARVRDDMSVLELGCGTGRVLVPLAGRCREIVGVDSSKDMIDRCREKIGSLKNASARVGDITKLALSNQFDLIVAPYRVLQALESSAEVDGLFAGIASHLKPGGSCILNVFRLNEKRQAMVAGWGRPDEIPAWEKTLPDGSVVVHTERKQRIDVVNSVLYPEMIYRTYRDGVLVHEFVQAIKMKWYHPDEFRALVTSHGFEIVGEWGGYAGETYGVGPELVLEFVDPTGRFPARSA